jgi:hypothetical protein
MSGFDSLKKVVMLLAILASIFGLLGFLFITLVFSPFLLFYLPGIIAAYVLIKYTFVLLPFYKNNFCKLGKPFKAVWRLLHDKLWYRMTGPKKFLWFFFYELVCWFYPNHKWRCMNYGYASEEKDGKLITNLKEEDEAERF